MPRDEYQMPVDPFDVVANLGLESVVHDDLRARLKANPQFTDKAVELERALIQEIMDTDPDLHTARRFADQLEDELEQAEAAVVIAGALKTETSLREAEGWLRQIQEDHLVKTAELLLELQRSMGWDYLGWVEEILVGLAFADKFQLLGQLYPLIDCVDRDEWDEAAEDMKKRIIAWMRKLVPELSDDYRQAHAAIEIYRCTRLEEDRLAARHCGSPLEVFVISGDRRDWDLALSKLYDGLVSGIQSYLVRLIQAACAHRCENDRNPSVISVTEIYELHNRLCGPEYKARAEIALYHLTGNSDYIDLAYVHVLKVDPVQDKLQLEMVALFCKAGKLNLARQCAKHISLDNPLASIRAFAAIYAARHKDQDQEE